MKVSSAYIYTVHVHHLSTLFHIGKQVIVQVNKGGKYCLSTNLSIPANESLMSLWAMTPGSNEDCSCYIPQNSNMAMPKCPCVGHRSAEFTVKYYGPKKLICFENLYLVESLKVFLFSEVNNLCSPNKSSASQKFHVGTEIKNGRNSLHSFGIQILIVSLLISF